MKNELKFQKILVGIYEKLQIILSDNKNLVVACSGGRDSVFLAYLLREVFLRYKLDINRLALAHMNYHLRDEDSNLDAKFVKELAASYSIPCYMQEAFYEKHDGVQDWARKLRYDFFESLHIKHNAVIAIAHQLNDVAENILFRLTRGSLVSNLVGMRELNSSSSYIWRPLLDISRNTIDQYILKFNLAYREDRSNSSRKYSRNKIRHDILPELEKMYPNATQRIVNTTMDAIDIANYTKNNLLKQISSFKNNKIPVSFIRNLPNGVCFLLFDILLEKLDCSNFQMSRSNFYNFINKIKSGQKRARKWTLSMAHGLNLCYDNGLVYIAKDS